MAFRTIIWDKTQDIWYSGLELPEHKTLLSNTQTPASEILLYPQANITIVWQSSDPNIVEVVSEHIITKKPGEAILYATMQDYAIKHSCKIEVKSPSAKYGIAIWDKASDTWEHEYQSTVFAHLIRNNGRYYTFQRGEWVELDTLFPTQEDFESNSVDLDEIRSKINLLQNPEVVTWTDSDQSLSLSVTGKKDVIKDLTDPKILAYNTTEEKPETVVKGIPKDNYYKYNVTIDDSTTPTTPDKVLISETDWVTDDVSETAIVPTGFVNKLNPYDICVNVTQFDDQKISERGQVLLYNEAPIFILGTVSNNTLSAVIDDPDGDKIRYKIMLNGQQIYPEEGEWTGFFATPFPVFYQFKNKDIKIGEDNSCLLIAEDEYGTQATHNLSFVGDYSGLIFTDSDYEYYSVDPDTILKRLNFGMIIAGYSSGIAEVKLINKNYYPVTNIRLTLDKSQIRPRTDVKISKYSGDGFTGADTLLFTQRLEPNEEISFYVQARSHMSAYGSSIFSIRASADGIIE